MGAWWGKLVGGAIGLAVGGPLGSAVGVLLGHRLDQGEGLIPSHRANLRRAQRAFLEVNFAVMGHLAKADGRVSERDIAFAEGVMTRLGLDDDERRQAIAQFKRGKAGDLDLDAELARFGRVSRHLPTLVETFLELQVQAIHAEAMPTPRQVELLMHACTRLGVPLKRLQQRLQRERLMRDRARAPGGRGRPPPVHRRSPLQEAYTVLGVDPGASLEEVKRAYRRLMSRHHPDKLASQGLSEEAMRRAADKTGEIRRAYEIISEARAGQ